MNNPDASFSAAPGRLQESGGHGWGRRAVRSDCAFLSLAVLGSAVLYLFRIGFYADDWAFLGVMHNSGPSLVNQFVALAPEMAMRPVQMGLLSVIYHFFGASPLPFQVVNLAALTAGTVLFYLVLRELGLPRIASLSVPLLYAVLPHYSTDRFWIAAQQATVSMPLYFLSLYADLRAAGSRGGRGRWWTLAGAARVLCVLSYEVFLPLLLLNPLLAWMHARRRQPSPGEWITRWAGLLRLYALTGLTLAPVLLYKAQVTNRLGGSKNWLDQIGWFWWVTKGAAARALGEFGMLMPRTVWRLWEGHPSFRVALASAALGVISYLYLARIARRNGPIPTRRDCLLLAASGVAVLVAGYAIFLITRNGGNTAAGINNRIAIAGTVGVALVMAGAAAWLAGWLPAIARARVMALLVSATVAAAAFIDNTLASFWIEAYRREGEVLNGIQRTFPSMPGPATLLLDGVCPYIGPAVVFESPWDLAGALQLLYGEDDLQADVVTPNLTVTDTAVTTWLYDPSDATHYPYGHITMFNARDATAHEIPDAAAARRYLAMYNPDRTSGCPRGVAGFGVPVF